MFDTIYIEAQLREHSRVADILGRYPNAAVVLCERYTEIFNRKAQNFRLQKARPALILTEKFKNFILPAPAGYGIGAEHNFYFSHLLNCLYDCRYCFLQGMYRSAHYVLFVNYHDFEQAIFKTVAEHPGEALHFFTGYDCDSLALEPVTRFVESFLPIFKKLPQHTFELRTKSARVRQLLESEALSNVVVAYSFTPAVMAQALEHKTPTPEARLAAMVTLQQHGWPVGLRFDPLIYMDNYQHHYREMFKDIFTQLDIERIHSASLGGFRLPKAFYRTMTKLYPDELLFASPLAERDGMISYKTSLNNEMFEFCRNEILKYLPEDRFYPYFTPLDPRQSP